MVNEFQKENNNILKEIKEPEEETQILFFCK